MKIIIANKYYYPRGGDCIHTIQLKALLEKYGHKVAIFSMKYDKNISDEYDKYWPSEVSFTSKSPSNIIKSIIRPFGVSEVKRKWIKLLIDFQPDVVHLHNIHSQLSPILAKISKEKKIPVVWTLHDYKLICSTYTFIDGRNEVCEDCLIDQKAVVRKRCIKNSLLGSYLGYLESRMWNKERLNEYTRLFISPSKFLKNKMVEAGYPENKILHQNNFIENSKFDSETVSRRHKNIVYIGRISREKGVETLCKAFQKVSGNKLLIIGDGPLKRKLEKQYSSDIIEFLGFMTWDAIKDILSSSKFMVVPSEWYENNPLTILESLALGTPVLGANIGGIPELIDESNGMLFDSGSVISLSDGIDKMLNKNDWDFNLIHTNAKLKFDEESYYNKIIDIYSKISRERKSEWI